MAVLSSLGFHLTEHCNMNCAGCSHFSTLAEPSFADMEQYKKDIKRMAELFTNISGFYIYGGEPLLNRDINEYIKITKETFPNTNLMVLTNGILLKKMPTSFWDTLKKYSCQIIFDAYPSIHDKADDITYFVQQQGVEIRCMKFGLFTKIVRLDAGDKVDIFDQCEQRLCHYLIDGTISVCGMPHFVKHFNKYFDKNIPSDGIYNIHDVDMTGDKILELFSKPTETCRYCRTGRGVPIACEKSKKEMSEWCI